MSQPPDANPPDARPVDVSVCAPAYNEQQNVRPLCEEIAAVLRPTDWRFEIVLCDDGSTDGTLAEMRAVQRDVPELRVLAHARNAGQSAATFTCFRAAHGRFIVTLDSDLQNDPAEIPRMLQMLADDACDMVNGWRKDRQDSWFRRVCTKIANGYRNWRSGASIHDSACGLKAYKRACLEHIAHWTFGGMHRFLPTLVEIAGFRVDEVVVHHRPRVAGEAKYGMWNRVFKAMRDLKAVRWMKRRHRFSSAREIPPDDGPRKDDA
jgi:glycosyltransferase involved in cell wall biosynthesis